MRVYVPVTMAMIADLVREGSLLPVNGTAFAVTPALREAYASGSDDELAEVAMGEAARASLRLLAAEADLAEAATPAETESADTEPADAEPADAVPAAMKPAGGGVAPRRAVLAVDVEDARPRPDLDDAVVRLGGPISLAQVASAHVDTADAESAVAKAIAVIDAADLGDPDAEFVVEDAQDHELAWYARQEISFLMELM